MAFGAGLLRASAAESPGAEAVSAPAAGTADSASDRFEPDAIPPMAPRKERRRQPPRAPDGGFRNGISEDPPLLRIYFPPNPPPMGVEVVTRGNRGPVSDAPEPLKFFVSAPFYAPLSTRLIRRDLDEELRLRINNWRRDWRRNLAELQDALYGLQGGEPDERAGQLHLLARQQARRLIESEKEADELRTALYNISVIGSDGDWNARREWRLGKGKLKKPREEIALFEYQVLRAAVFYLEGLSPEQRLLLREMVMELEDTIFRGDSEPLAAFGFRFFSPHTARIRLPDTAPPDLQDKFAVYTAEKNQIKAQIRDLIYELENYVLDSSRKKACEALAAEQAEDFEALAALAEDIRHDLARLPEFVRTPMPKPLPAELEFLISKFTREKQRLQNGYIRKLRILRRNNPPPRPEAGAEARAAWQERIAQAAEQLGADYKREVAGELRELSRDLDVIAAGIERATGEPLEEGFGSSADSFLTEFVAKRRAAESAFYYETAVLEPGLSPEQRRLLYAAAIERMELPLPGAELQAYRIPGTLLDSPLR